MTIRLYNKINETKPFYRKMVAYLLVAGAFAYGVGEVDSSQKQFAKETAQRQQQNCVLFEKVHIQTVIRLRNTYKYLDSLTPKQKAETLNKFIISTLPQVEADVRLNDTPKYCSNPGFGLDEPIPTIPKRPASLRSPIKADKS